jgi:two-component system phosphate regulon sensor histidine kinase PhoR
MNSPDARPGHQATTSARKRQSRARDIGMVVIAAAVVLAMLAISGQVNWPAALLGVAALGTFTFFWFFGTVDPAQETGEDQAAADIAARRARAAQERSFRSALVEALSEPTMYIDGHGKVEAANAAARKEFRFVGADPVLSAVVRRPEVLDAVAAVRQGEGPQRFEFVERAETDRYFSCVAAPLGGGVLVSMHDLTDIKRAEFARVDFLANASHELRTPLTSLSGFIETLRGPARDDPEARERFLEIMQGQADRMRRLISDLLSLSRIELVEHRPPEGEADLAGVVREVVAAMEPVAAERGVKVAVTGLGNAVIVTGVRDELAQVVQNLVDNAVKYSEKGGVVLVDLVSDVAPDAAAARAGRQWAEAGHMSIVTAPGAARGPSAALRVTDAGPGIERQYLPRLSERFYRVDPGRGLRPGTGLGLAIVKHVVQRHRGEFLVESEPGRGSAFGVVLPMAKAASA